MNRRMGLLVTFIIVTTSILADWGGSDGENATAETQEPQAEGLVPGEREAGVQTEKGNGHDTGHGVQDGSPAVSGGGRATGTGNEPLQKGLGSGEAHGGNASKTGEEAGAGKEQGNGESESSRAMAGVADGRNNGHYVGSFKLTAYTAGYESTGKRPGHPDYGKVAISGSKRADFQEVYVKEGHTIAADWGVLPPGTVVYIEGIGERVVEDKGGAIKGKSIDVYIPGLQEAKAFGVQKADVYIIEWGK